MQLTRDVFAGRHGLAVTYWLWGVVGSLVVTAIAWGATAYSVKLINDPVPYNILIYGVAIFAIAWSVFVCLAIINASTYQRERGLWGWVATVFAGLGLLNTARTVAILVGALPLTFNDIEQSIAAESLALPVQIEEGLTLDRIEADSTERTITYHYGLDTPTFDTSAVDNAQLKADVIGGGCEDIGDWLAGPVSKVIMVWHAQDGSTVSVEILPADCGV